MENVNWQGGREVAGGETDKKAPPHYYWRSHLFGGFGGSGAPLKRSARYALPEQDAAIPAEVDRRVFAANWPAALEVAEYQRETAPAVQAALVAEEVPPPRPEPIAPAPPPSKKPKKALPAPPPAPPGTAERFKALPTPPPPVWKKP